MAMAARGGGGEIYMYLFISNQGLMGDDEDNPPSSFFRARHKSPLGVLESPRRGGCGDRLSRSAPEGKRAAPASPRRIVQFSATSEVVVNTLGQLNLGSVEVLRDLELASEA